MFLVSFLIKRLLHYPCFSEICFFNSAVPVTVLVTLLRGLSSRWGRRTVPVLGMIWAVWAAAGQPAVDESRWRWLCSLRQAPSYLRASSLSLAQRMKKPAPGTLTAKFLLIKVLARALVHRRPSVRATTGCQLTATCHPRPGPSEHPQQNPSPQALHSGRQTPCFPGPACGREQRLGASVSSPAGPFPRGPHQAPLVLPPPALGARSWLSKHCLLE